MQGTRTPATAASAATPGAASTAPQASHASSLQSRELFRATTLHAKIVCRILSLLHWTKDGTCRVSVSESGMHIHMVDGGKCVHATAVVREEVFAGIALPARGTQVFFAVNLSHLVHACSMTGPGQQLYPMVLRYPGPDGSLLLEAVEGEHSTSCALSAKPWDGELADLAFGKREVLVRATIKAELLKDVVMDLELMNAESVDIAFDRDQQSLTFSGGNPGSGTVAIDCRTHVANSLVMTLDVRRSGVTTLALSHLAQTVKTDYFRDATSSSDQVTFRVNEAGTVCILYHIKAHEVATTCGVEVTILSQFKPSANADDDPLQMTPIGMA